MRSTPSGTLYDRQRRDWVAFVPPYEQSDVSLFKPHRDTHREGIGYGRVVIRMFFERRVLTHNAIIQKVGTGGGFLATTVLEPVRSGYPLRSEISSQSRTGKPKLNTRGENCKTGR